MNSLDSCTRICKSKRKPQNESHVKNRVADYVIPRKLNVMQVRRNYGVIYIGNRREAATLVINYKLEAQRAAQQDA